MSREGEHPSPHPHGGYAPMRTGPHPSHPSGGGPPPPYLSNNPPKGYSPYHRPGGPPPPPGYYSHHAPPPPSIQLSPLAESRYPPSSSARHRHQHDEQYARHPPPPPHYLSPRHGPPPPLAQHQYHHPHHQHVVPTIHTSVSYPPPPPPSAAPQGYPSPGTPGSHGGGPPPQPPPQQPAAAVSPSRPAPHPADKFGKTITVSNRKSINEGHPPPPSSWSPPSQVTILRTAPVGGRADGAAHFGPSKSGAFLPYRPVARRPTNAHAHAHPETPKEEDDVDGTNRDDKCPAPPKAHVEIVNLETDTDDKTSSNTKKQANSSDESSSDEELKAVNNQSEMKNDKEMTESAQADSAEERRDDNKAELMKQDYMEEERPIVAPTEPSDMEECRDDRDKNNETMNEEATGDGEKQVGASASSVDVAMKVSESASKDTASVDIDKDAPEDINAATGELKQAANDGETTSGKERKKPVPITTTLKRPRSTVRDGGEQAVNVNDDTPKHINISHPPASSTSVFRYPAQDHHQQQHGSKRSKLSEDMQDTRRSSHTHERPSTTSVYGYPPDLLTTTNKRRSYSIESIEEETRQDVPTTPGGQYDSHRHQPSSSYGRDEGYYNYHEDAQYYQHHPPPPPPPPGQVISHAPSHGESYPGIEYQESLGGGEGEGEVSGIHGSWTLADPATPNTPSKFIEPASYLNTPSRSLSWEVPAGTLSAIGSTLSFGLQTSMSNVRSSPTNNRSSPSSKAKLDGKKDNAEAIMEEEEDDDIPPLPNSGSNLPPRKRVLLAPRPSGPSSKLFEPPRPTNSRDGAGDHHHQHGESRGKERTIEARDDVKETARETSRESKYAPHTVHNPHEQRRQAPPGPYGPPPIVRSYSYDRHGHNGGGGGGMHHPPQGRYEYDPRYEPPRHHHQGGRYHPHDHHHRGGDSRRDPYESPGRYHPPPDYVDSRGHAKYPPHAPPPGAAPWGTPPHTSSNGRPYNHHHSSPHRSPHGTPGGGGNDRDLGGDDGGGSRSFDSSVSRKSFRSLDDLEEPESLLYRPSFSWERGIEPVPYSAAGAGHHHPHHPSSQHHHQGHGPGAAATGHPYPQGSHSGSGGPPNTVAAGMIQLREQQKIMKALTMRSEIRTIGNPNSPVGLILLLAMPQDRHCLSETLCIVRNNVEVFTATEVDINAPAPGRKRPIQVGQVGLRCVYCRMCAQRDRVKRATCFPSSMKRIYRAVIDMKLDHFKNCPYVPPGLKARLDQLQAGSTRSTGMTVQYFVKSACEMGMVDMEDGVCIDLKRVGIKNDDVYGMDGPSTEQMAASAVAAAGSRRDRDRAQPQHGYAAHHYPPGPPPPHIMSYPKPKGRKRPKKKQQYPAEASRAAPSHSAMVSHHGPPPPSQPPFQAVGMEITEPPQPQGGRILPPPPGKRYSGKVLLALPEDKNFLSPLRCFLRENVCAFTATARDIAVRTPTTFSVRVGQVGVGCIHCLAVPPKSRSNRAVCFPFTVARIYQSVADIQRFHLGECRMMPPEVRDNFLRLQSESAKGSRGLATRTYWIDSAKKIGLADGPAGMYFNRDPSLPPPPPEDDAQSLDILAQVASNNDSGGRHPLVTPEDKPTIAEFLYLVMEQLRPCRFTDADRNKRRSKNVGSIGVECKHCAGKIDGRKFFWSSVSAAESNFVSVHSHMLSCKYIPGPLKTELARLKALRREQTSRLKTGSQKAFFTRVWARLHGTPAPAPRSDMGKSTAMVGGVVIRAQPAVPVHQPKTFLKEVAIDAAAPSKMKNAEQNQPIASNTIHDEPRRSHDSDELRALLESKSTLSSMPSVDESILKHATRDGPATLEMDLGNSGSASADDDHILKTEHMSGEGEDESDHKNITSAGSNLTSVALNLSAVSVHCKEEQGGACGVDGK